METVEVFLANQTMRGLSAKTVERRRWTLTAFLAATGGTTRDATTVDVERFVAARTAAETRRALLGDLRAFYRWAATRELVDNDPTAVVESPKVPRRLASPVSQHDLRRAWDAGSFRMRCIIGLAAGAGLRVSEIAALEMANVDFDNLTIIVRNGKGGVDRAVPMASPLADLLRHAGPGKVVAYKNGESVSDAIRSHFRRLGIDHRPHDMRHSFATECARICGGNMVVVAQLLGHASIQTTQRYTAALPGGRDVVESLWAA